MARGKRTDETPDLLASLNKVQVGPPTATSGSKPVTLTIQELAPYGGIHRIAGEIDSLEKGSIGKPIRDAMFNYMIPEGVLLGKAPKNPKGIDGNHRAEASLQLRRSTAVVDGDKLARLTSLNLPLGRKEFAPHTLRLKPALFADKNLINRMLAALIKAGFDAIEMFEEQTEAAVALVSDETIDGIFAMVKKAREKAVEEGNKVQPFPDSEVRELLEMVLSPSIRIEQFYGDLPEALKEVRKLLCPTPEDLAEAKALAVERAKSECKPAGSAAIAAAAVAAVGPQTEEERLAAGMAGMFSHTGPEARRVSASRVGYRTRSRGARK